MDGGDAQYPDRAISAESKHVLGVACVQFGVDSATEAELERRFLQLAYAVSHLSSCGVAVSGYVAVLRPETRDQIQRLRMRYGVGDAVQIVYASLLIADMTRLADAADAADKQCDRSLVQSVAREIAIEALQREIAVREPGVVELTPHASNPFGVDWDYYGRRPCAVGRSETDNASCPRLF